MVLLAVRVIVGAALVAVSVYGVVRFRGTALRSPEYVVRPDAAFWCLGRWLRDSEWTPAGLKWRSQVFRWWVLCVALVLLLAALFANWAAA